MFEIEIYQEIFQAGEASECPPEDFMGRIGTHFGSLEWLGKIGGARECPIGTFANRMGRLLFLADKLIKKYGESKSVSGSCSPSEIGVKTIGELMSKRLELEVTPVIWESEVGETIRKLGEVVDYFDPKVENYFKKVEGNHNWSALWEDEKGDRLSFDGCYDLLLGENYLLDSKCSLRFLVRYVNCSIRNEYRQEKERIREKVEVGWDNF